MKYIKIGDMSTIAGISPSGLRKYEKYGIIEPEIDPDTGHRVYDGMQMGHLLNARRFRQFYFSLDDISDMH
ncbi:MAG: MerR family transcriptional regulator [Tissierellia bacterium]|nr:MerR family transcriptional regulator [Tissierellia bacterium]